MHRLTLSAEDGAARGHLVGWMRESGLKLTVDVMGNMVGLLDWAGPDAPVVMSGSNLDSQPQGGHFGGAYGVLAACEAVDAVRAQIDAASRAPRCNLAIVNWTNEEGARFQPSLLGSAVYICGSVAPVKPCGMDGVTMEPSVYSWRSVPQIPHRIGRI